MIAFLRLLVRVLFRFRAFNEAVLRTPGPVLLLPNHLSWIDWLFIGVCLEPDWKFVVSSVTAQASPVHRFIMLNRRTFPIDPLSPYAARHMAEFLQRGGRLVLFPEGRMSRTGSLMKLFDGTGFLLHKTGAKVITAYLRGPGRLVTSPNQERKRLLPRVSAHFSDVLTPPPCEHLSTAQARARLTGWLRDRMVTQHFDVEMRLGPATLPEALAETARSHARRPAMRDVNQQLTYAQFAQGAAVLAEKFAEVLAAKPGGAGLPGGRPGTPAGGLPARVGILLPNVNAHPVSLLALWSLGVTPAVLNYTTGPAILRACAELAGLRHIITSRAFLERAKLDVTSLQQAGVELIHLEDVRQRVGLGTKLRAALGVLRLKLPAARDPDATAVVLFTSGSEGVPKGVELTHRNLLANIRQMQAISDLQDWDRFFTALPLFHSFGLTAGTLLPLVRGSFVFLYPSPLHYRVVPTIFYNFDCTVLLATNTFLNGYARRASTYDFRSLRYLFAGAEKIQEATAAEWSRRFGVRVLEGYGATECSPVISVNTPLQPRHGTAGRLLPGLEWKLEAVEGVSEQSEVPNPTSGGERIGADPAGDGRTPAPAPTASRQSPITTGRLLVRGPNVMKGYLNPDANAKFLALRGWYDTGDIVSVDEDNFVRIQGRLKRFAKVSGEMVSLTAVEDALAGAFPHYGTRLQIAVLARPDADKGELLIAVSNEPRLTADEVRAAIKARGLPNLSVPRELKYVKEIPRLGTGKVNHRELERLV